MYLILLGGLVLFLCNGCNALGIPDEDLIDGNCPICGAKVKEMCELDHLCTCAVDITGGTHTCPKCGEFVCPCGSHSVFVISRVTGYLANVSSWGNGKRAEFADRQRYAIK
jgi:hypothetical protein